MAQHKRAERCGLAIRMKVQDQTGHRGWRGENNNNNKEIALNRVKQRDVAVNYDWGINLQTLHNKFKEQWTKRKTNKEPISERQRQYLRRTKTRRSTAICSRLSRGVRERSGSVLAGKEAQCCIKKRITTEGTWKDTGKKNLAKCKFIQQTKMETGFLLLYSHMLVISHVQYAGKKGKKFSFHLQYICMFKSESVVCTQTLQLCGFDTIIWK